MDFNGNFMDIVLWTLWFFCFFAFIWVMFAVFADLFGDHALGGGAKTLWTLFIIFIPFLGLLVYLIARGGGMAHRAAEKQATARAAQDAYIRTVANTATPADQIAQAKAMLDSGAITQAEFETIKAKALV